MLNDMCRLQFLVLRLRLASPPKDQTEKNSAMEAVTNWELTLVAILTEDKITLWVQNVESSSLARSTSLKFFVDFNFDKFLAQAGILAGTFL